MTRFDKAHLPKRLPIAIDSSIGLTSKEHNELVLAVMSIVRKIIRREKSVIKRRVLRDCISSTAETYANASFGAEENRIRRKYVKEYLKKNKVTKKKASKK
jgi:hypothetical protein